MVLTDANRSLLNECTGDTSIPNLMLCGKPGIGKTSLAKILVNDVLKCQYIYINASDENGIDTVRNKINNFSVTKSIDGNIKVIILDEVDGLTMDAQRALRNTMEEYTDFVRFILTANFEHRVIPAVQSRCQSVDLTPNLEDYLARCLYVLDKEQINHNTDHVTQLKQYYPDLRKAINEMQKQSITGTLVLNNEHTYNSFSNNVFKLITSGKVLQIRKNVIQSEHVFGGDYISLLRSMFNIITDQQLNDMQKKECMLVVSEYIYRTAFVADQEINFYTCMLAVSKIITQAR
ncbi:AAA family ATPase [bacterium]|nr:AAA family ATPase [bacterium]